MEKRVNIRCSDSERELVEQLARLESLPDISSAIRLAITEALQKRGIVVPQGDFGKKQEGRPKENRQPTFEPLAV